MGIVYYFPPTLSMLPPVRSESAWFLLLGNTFDSDVMYISTTNIGDKTLTNQSSTEKHSRNMKKHKYSDKLNDQPKPFLVMCVSFIYFKFKNVPSCLQSYHLSFKDYIVKCILGLIGLNLGNLFPFSVVYQVVKRLKSMKSLWKCEMDWYIFEWE